MNQKSVLLILGLVLVVLGIVSFSSSTLLGVVFVVAAIVVLIVLVSRPSRQQRQQVFGPAVRSWRYCGRREYQTTIVFTEVMTRRTWLFVTCIAGMAFSGAVLLLRIPSLFSSDDNTSIWVAVVLGCLVLAFAGGAWYWKPLFPVVREDR